MPNENWRPVPTWDRYEVSDLGRVRNAHTGRVLKPSWHRSGYRSIGLCRGGTRTTYTVHKLVMWAYTGQVADFPRRVCRHIDGDRRNNRLDNLAWGTVADNARDMIAHGNSGLGVVTPRLTQAEQARIDGLYNAGVPVMHIAAAMGRAIITVQRYLSRQRQEQTR